MTAFEAGLTLVVCICCAAALGQQEADEPQFGPRAEWPENPECSDALQAAFDAGREGVVYIPAGQYRVTRPIVVQTGTTIMGAGYCATMLLTEKPLPAILHLRHVGGPMSIIRDLWVAGPAVTPSAARGLNGEIPRGARNDTLGGQPGAAGPTRGQCGGRRAPLSSHGPRGRAGYGS